MCRKALLAVPEPDAFRNKRGSPKDKRYTRISLCNKFTPYYMILMKGLLRGVNLSSVKLQSDSFSTKKPRDRERASAN